MPGFLDRDAPSVEAEYVSFMDYDLLGKFIFKSALIHVFHYRSLRNIEIPTARHGAKFLGGDAKLRFGSRVIDFEIKCAKVNISRKNSRNPNEGWIFKPLLRTNETSKLKNYDVLFAIGVLAPSAGTPEYWKFSEHIAKRHLPREVRALLTEYPHTKEFLLRCGFFVIPKSRLTANHIDLTISTIPRSPYAHYFAWGYDHERCLTIWRNALRGIRTSSCLQDDDSPSEAQAVLGLD